MKISHIFGVLFGLMGVAVAIAGVRLSLTNTQAAPVLLTRPQAAVDRAEAMMNALCSGDYASAGQYLYGTPSLVDETESSGEAEELIWAAFTDSMAYEFLSDCYATDSGVAIDVKITSMQISSVTENLKERSQALLNQGVAEAEDVSEIYDEDNNYRASFVLEVLRQATEQAIAEDARTEEHTLTLYMIYAGDNWWILPEQDLLSAVSGWVAG